MNENLVMPSEYLVACHTDNVGVGSTFVAVQGQKENGCAYIYKALQKGANTIVVQKNTTIADDLLDALVHTRARLLYVDNPRAALAQLSAQALNYPAKQLRILGITGTKGKTTSSFLLGHILRNAGYRTALLSTVKNKILDVEFKTNLTTQHPDYLHNFFALCVQAHVDYVVMEVAAQATSLHRVAGLEFDGLIFTNFDKEHAEFYPNMDDYFAAKVAVLNQLKPGAPLLLNADDARVSQLHEQYRHALKFGITNTQADYHGVISGNSLEQLQLEVAVPLHHIFACPSLVGAFNAYNILGVVGLCLQLGLTAHNIAQGLCTFTSVPGRLERYDLPNGARCFIDYAHNPSSFIAVLSMMRMLTNHLIVVFGAGGARDTTKRPMMGAIAAQFADIVVITSDNPRTEDPASIAQDIIVGIDADKTHKIICDLDRESAIKKAYAASTPTSVIMLLGKGPDEYQIIGDQKFDFSEKEIVKSL